MTKPVALLLGAVLSLHVLVGCGGAPGGAGGAGGVVGKPTVAYVTNGIDPFWTIGEKGAKAGEKDFNVNVEVRMPGKNGVEDQKRMVQELLTRKVSGIAISPIDAENQTDFLDEIAGRANLITQDSDAPKSKRQCFIGVDNYKAGRMCGELVKEALPDGGSIMIFVGRLEQLNARQRRQGVIDELLGRSEDATRYDEPQGEIKGDKYTILDTRTDQFDYGKAKSQAEDAMARHPDLGCMVGLFAYNPPNCLEAIREANKLGKIKVVGFDEAAGTLQGIIDGHVHGTVVQDPYKYGYESVRILAGLAKGDKSVLPAGGVLSIAPRRVDKKNVEAFWVELKKLTGETKAEDKK